MTTATKTGVIEYPISVQVNTGSIIYISATRESIEAYGNVNELVSQMVKPLKDVSRIEVALYSEELEDMVTEVTYDVELEAYLNLHERVEVSYDFYGIGELEKERGYIEHRDSWLPCYTIRKQIQHANAYELMADAIVHIETVEAVKQRARNERSLAYYHNNEKRKEYVNRKSYERHLRDKRKRELAREASKRYRERKRQQAN